MTFREFIKLCEDGLWYGDGPHETPGTKRQNVVDLYNHKYGQKGGAGPGPMAAPAPPPKKMKKK